jgi:hypothetical protein
VYYIYHDYIFTLDFPWLGKYCVLHLPWLYIYFGFPLARLEWSILLKSVRLPLQQQQEGRSNPTSGWDWRWTLVKRLVEWHYSLLSVLNMLSGDQKIWWVEEHIDNIWRMNAQWCDKSPTTLWLHAISHSKMVNNENPGQWDVEVFIIGDCRLNLTQIRW